MQVRRTQVSLRGGANVQVYDTGEGPALLMLHAGVSDHRMWDDQWERLQNHFRLVRFDWRGFGETAHTPGEFSYAEDVLRIMDALHIDRAILMAASFGGGVAIQVAVEHPERVAKMVLVGPGVPGYHGHNPPHVEREFRRADEAWDRGDTTDFLSRMEALWIIGPGRQEAQVDPGYLARARTLLASIDRPQNGAESDGGGRLAVGQLNRLTIPTLVVVGDQDVPEVMDAAQYLRGALPDVELEVIHDAAHLPNLEKPVAFHQVLSRWLGMRKGAS